MATKKVLVLAYPGCQTLDVAGPVDTLLLTNEVCADRGMNHAPYKVELVAPKSGSVATHGGVIRLNIDRAISDISDEELSNLDTFMIAGGFSAVEVRTDSDVIDFIRRASQRASRIASVCTSAFLFAESGVLDGRKVATHWRVAKPLAASYPEIEVDPDAIVCRDGDVWSSGGISAGVDLALALVEHDLGADVARSVARMMVMFLARPGGQTQFEFPVTEPEEPVPQADVMMQEIISLIRLHPNADLRLAAIARRFNLTGRTLARRFRAFTGMTLGRFVEEARIAHARVRLEDSDETLAQIAIHSGFGSADSMRRAFTRNLSINPQDYRARFKSAFQGDVPA